jgi:signal transduction histidine kinase/CheY-like chemotaxis protein
MVKSSTNSSATAAEEDGLSISSKEEQREGASTEIGARRRRTRTQDCNANDNHNNDDDVVVDDDCVIGGSNNIKNSKTEESSSSVVVVPHGGRTEIATKKNRRVTLYHKVRAMMPYSTTFWVSLLVFIALAAVCIVIVTTIALDRRAEREDEAIHLAEETGLYFSNQLDRAILPLFSIAQFATNLDIFKVLPAQIGSGGAPGSLPYLPRETNASSLLRNVTGLCDDPELVSRFISIASAIKETASMNGILVNLQLAPHGVICLLHPMNNTEDFEDGKFLDSSGAWGLDLLHDPRMMFIAQASLPNEDVTVAGPLALVQCPTCGNFFIARLPIFDPNHTIVDMNGVSYPRWGFATALIDWNRLVVQSGVYESFQERRGRAQYEFQLTRTDKLFNATDNTYQEKIVVLAGSLDSNPNDDSYANFQEVSKGHQLITVALATTNNEWEMHISYSNQDIQSWTIIVAVACFVVSGAIALLVYMVLRQKQAHYSMQAKTSAQDAKVETERNITAYFAHELRNPLSAIDSALQTIIEEDLPTSTQELIQGMKISSSLMASIMNNLLDARKLQEGMMEIRTHPLSLGELVDGVYKMMLPLTRSGVQFLVEKVRLTGREWVVGDSHRIQQVLSNMITNAIKYTLSGSIALRVSWTIDEQVCFEVDDTGPGIPKSEQERLFERFVQRGGAPGTGLGLAISRQICEIMGGSIQFESDPTVKPGTTCRVILPLELYSRPTDEDSSMLSPSLANTKELLTGPIRILIMDDVKMNRLMLQRRIERAIAPEAKITMAMNGEEALVLTEDHTFDIIICDQYMEEAGGVLVGTDVVIALRRNHVNALIVGCSGNDLNIEFMNAGADLVWGKPLPSNDQIIAQFREGLLARNLI